MLILGIDGSLTCTGLAVVDVSVPCREIIMHTERARTSPEDGTDTFRARNLAASAVYVARKWSVDLVGLEMPYLDPHKAGNAAMRLSRLGATFENALVDAGFQVVQVAAATTGSMLGIKPRTKRAERKRIAIANVRSRYGLDVTEDEADAIGVALGAWRNHLGALVRSGGRDAGDGVCGVHAGRDIAGPARPERGVVVR